MTAGLQSDVDIRAPRVRRVPERRDFGVRSSAPTVIPLSDDAPPPDDDRADQWVGGRSLETTPREAQRKAHELFVRWRHIRLSREQGTKG